MKASINMADIDVQIDDNVGEGQAKKIIVTLPQLQVKQIDVDMASLDYMFVKKSANTADVSEEAYAACIADAGSDAGEMKCSYRWRKKIVRIQSRHCSCRS